MKATPQIVWKQSKFFQKHHGRLLRRFTHSPSFEAQCRCFFSVTVLFQASTCLTTFARDKSKSIQATFHQHYQSVW